MNLAKKTILVVEDEREMARGLKDILEFEGYEVINAASGREGLDAVSRKPDCVILDLMLPDLDGFEVCRRLRAAGYTMPIIMLTARSQEIDKVRGLELADGALHQLLDLDLDAWHREIDDIGRYLEDLKRQQPTSPPGSTFFFGGIPSFLAWQAGDGPLHLRLERDVVRHGVGDVLDGQPARVRRPQESRPPAGARHEPGAADSQPALRRGRVHPGLRTGPGDDAGAGRRRRSVPS